LSVVCACVEHHSLLLADSAAYAWPFHHAHCNNWFGARPWAYAVSRASVLGVVVVPAGRTVAVGQWSVWTGNKKVVEQETLPV